jgi:hypothetical protein
VVERRHGILLLIPCYIPEGSVERIKEKKIYKIMVLQGMKDG